MSWAFSTGESDAIVNKALMKKGRDEGKKKRLAPRKRPKGVIWQKSQCFVMPSRNRAGDIGSPEVEADFKHSINLAQFLFCHTGLRRRGKM
jgi:hypothetical protein